MIYRRLILLAFAAFIAGQIWRVISADVTATGTIAWLLAGLVVILILPEERAVFRQLKDMLQAWRGGNTAEAKK